MQVTESMVATPQGRGVAVGTRRGGLGGKRKPVLKGPRKAMPAELMPDVAGLDLEDQVARLHGAYVAWSQQRSATGSDRMDQDRISRVLRMYGQLRRLGCNLENAQSFREKHAEMLLGLWRKEGRQISTIRSDWAIVRTWTLALGKPGTVHELEHYWPDAPVVDRGAQRTRAQLREQTHGDPAVLTELLRASDRTHWYVERMCHDLGLTVEEALRFSPGIAGDYLAGKIVVRTGRGGAERRTVAVDTDTKVLLVQEVVEFIVRKGRKVLAWQDMKPDRAVRKHQQRMTYARRKNRRADAAGSGQALSISEAGHDGASQVQQATSLAASAAGDEPSRESMGAAVPELAGESS